MNAEKQRKPRKRRKRSDGKPRSAMPIRRVTLDEVQALASALTFAEQPDLLESLERRVRDAAAPRAPLDLHGVCRGRFPEDVNIDEVLAEARTEWEKEWSEEGQFLD